MSVLAVDPKLIQQIGNILIYAGGAIVVVSIIVAIVRKTSKKD